MGLGPFNWKSSRSEFHGVSYHHLGAHSKDAARADHAGHAIPGMTVSGKTYIAVILPVKEVGILKEIGARVGSRAGGYSVRISGRSANFQRARRKKGPFFGLSLFLLLCWPIFRVIGIGFEPWVPPPPPSPPRMKIADYHVGLPAKNVFNTPEPLVG